VIIKMNAYKHHFITLAGH